MAHQYDRWIQEFILKDKDGNIIATVNESADAPGHPSGLPDYRRAQSVGIMINDIEYRFDRDSHGDPLDENTLQFNSQTGKWRLYIDESQTDFERILSFQCEVTFTENFIYPNTKLVFHSDKTNQRLSPSLDWSDDD